ncbi:hypothetical protein D3876_04500 [Sphingomonas cavernae]|uniref:Uncharacterized protein n=2 Tax=Sphingomonas cavernae TaxID=2320861 RepID=A0A418WSV0_9SPHN|nr:hypothetical protein D3876_04500 [Sphingomonas cavernae]
MLALAAGATVSQASSDKGEQRLAKALKGRVAGEPVNCVSASTIGGPQIIDSRTILYRQGARVWRNDLADNCPFLRQDRILVVELYGSNLCRNDMFSVIDRGGLSIPIGKCRFGQFTPYTKAK